MSLRLIAVLAWCSLAPWLPAQEFTTVPFDIRDQGKVPNGWFQAITGSGDPVWTVDRDETAPSPPAVLKQSARVPGPSFPLCIFRERSLQNGFVEVRFKTIAGKEDQAAGVIWRCQDSQNYYICRANALENNVVLYKVENGKRKALDIVGRAGGYGLEVPVAPQQWHALKVEFHESRFKVLLNGKPVFEVEDTTFDNAGHAGLWTKADSITLFDDFKIGP